MKKPVSGLLALLLLSGCSESTRETEMVGDESPAAGAAVETATPAARAAAGGAVADAAEGAPPVDAEGLLASTLQIAKTDDKRVMVHLGAPW